MTNKNMRNLPVVDDGHENWIQPLLNVFFGMTSMHFRWCFLTPIINIKEGDVKSFIEKQMKALYEEFPKNKLREKAFAENAKAFSAWIRNDSGYNENNAIGRHISDTERLLRGLRILAKQKAQEDYIIYLTKVMAFLINEDEASFIRSYDSLMELLWNGFPQYNYCTSLSKGENMVRALYTLMVCYAISSLGNIAEPEREGRIKELLLSDSGLPGIYDRTDKNIESYMLEYITVCEHYPINTIERFQELTQPRYMENIYVQSELIRLYASGVTLRNIAGRDTYYLKADSDMARKCWESIPEKYRNASIGLYLVGKNNNWLKESKVENKFVDAPSVRLMMLEETFRTAKYEEQQLWRQLEEIQMEMPYSLDLLLLMGELSLKSGIEAEDYDDRTGALNPRSAKSLVLYIKQHKIDWTVHPRGYDFMLRAGVEELSEEDIQHGAGIGSSECILLLLKNKAQADEMVYRYLTSGQAENLPEYTRAFIFQLIDYYTSEEANRQSVFFFHIILKLSDLLKKYYEQLQVRKCATWDELTEEEDKKMEEEERLLKEKNRELNRLRKECY